jgi:LemA protein
MSAGIIILIIAGVLVLWVLFTYNRLVTLRNRAKEGWSDIDVQLKRRHDLIPNLIESVKGIMGHERTLLENITKARAGAVAAQASGNTAELAKSESQLSGMLGQLTIAVEAYPEIKANQNMAQLMDELSDSENKIQASRRFYNGQVRDLNTMIETAPANVVAKAFSFTKMDFFEITDAKERENVKVSF